MCGPLPVLEPLQCWVCLGVRPHAPCTASHVIPADSGEVRLFPHFLGEETEVTQLTASEAAPGLLSSVLQGQIPRALDVLNS